MDSLLIGLIAAVAWSLLLVVVLGLCKVAAGADAHSDLTRANNRKRASERIRARDSVRPAAL